MLGACLYECLFHGAAVSSPAVAVRQSIAALVWFILKKRNHLKLGHLTANIAQDTERIITSYFLWQHYDRFGTMKRQIRTVSNCSFLFSRLSTLSALLLRVSLRRLISSFRIFSSTIRSFEKWRQNKRLLKNDWISQSISSWVSRTVKFKFATESLHRLNFNSQIKIVILLTVNHTSLIMLVQRI